MQLTEYVLVCARRVSVSLTYQIAPFDKKDNHLHPAIFLLHGRGADEEDLLGVAPQLDPRFICIAPRAPFPFSYGGYVWYDIEDIARPDERQFNESCDRLKRFIGEMKSEYPLDPGRVYVLGFSMGAVMAYALAMTTPDEIRGVLAHSGYWPEHLSERIHPEKLSQPYYFVAHGIYDPVIPIDYARRAREFLTTYKARFEYREYPLQHQMSEDSLRDISAWLTTNLKITS